MPNKAGGGAIATLRSTLDRAGLAPLHRLGQNFMIDSGAVEDVIRAAELSPGQRVVEIGPGTGILTRRLMAGGARVLAVELDAGLVRLLEDELVPTGLELIAGDALAGKQALHPAIVAAAGAAEWKLIANLPYDVSLAVILNALALPQPPRLIVVTVQLEAAQRLGARPGDPSWGASAAVCRAGARDIRILRRLPPACFYPRPRVTSALLRIEPGAGLRPGFGAWCRRIFAYRRKLIGRALRDSGVPRPAVAELLADAGVDSDQRVEMLDVGDLERLHAAVTRVVPELAADFTGAPDRQRGNRQA